MVNDLGFLQFMEKERALVLLVFLLLLAGCEADNTVLVLGKAFLGSNGVELESSDAHRIVFGVIKAHLVCECHDI